MRFVIKINGDQVIINGEQFEALTNVLHDAEFIEQQYVSSADGGGEDGTNYIKVVRRFDLHEKMTVAPMHEDYYQSRVLVTKLFDEKKAKK